MKSLLKSNVLLVFALAVVSYGQSPTTPVKWEAVSGKNNELLVFMPNGYLTSAEGEIYMGRPNRGGTRVKKHVTAYEGKSSDIVPVLEERLKLPEVKGVGVVGSFQVKEHAGAFKKHVSRVQFFWNKDRVYVVKAIAPAENDPVTRAYFESVRLIGTPEAIAPNASAGATATTIPPFVEKDPEKGDDAAAIPMSDADRSAIIIYAAKPKFGFDERSNAGSGKVKLKMLLSSSGKVSNVEVVSASSKLLERSTIEAAKQTVFIPAEKDGRLVSVYQIVEHSYEVGMR